ncbi:MAG: MerC domain-containing protein [Sphingomonas sp.]
MPYGYRAAGAGATDWLERAALGASAVCLVHCAGLPLLLAALPALSKLIALPESFHVWVLGFAVPISGATLLAGLRRHRTRRPLVAGGVGLALLSAGALVLLGGPYETPVTIAGSLCLAFAHVSNWRLRHRGHRHG